MDNDDDEADLNIATAYLCMWTKNVIIRKYVYNHLNIQWDRYGLQVERVLCERVQAFVFVCADVKSVDCSRLDCKWTWIVRPMDETMCAIPIKWICNCYPRAHTHKTHDREWGEAHIDQIFPIQLKVHIWFYMLINTPYVEYTHKCYSLNTIEFGGNPKRK